jgi:hypothetical protein
MQDRLSFRFGFDTHERTELKKPTDGSNNCRSGGCSGGCGCHKKRKGGTESNLIFNGL